MKQNHLYRSWHQNHGVDTLPQPYDNILPNKENAAYNLINTICIFHDFLFIINLSYAAVKLYSGLVWNRCTVFTVCAMCNNIFHAWLREFTRYLDAWFYLLYLHPIFTRVFRWKVDIWILTNMPFVSFIIIILIITHVCCVYSHLICFALFTSCFRILKWTLLRL